MEAGIIFVSWEDSFSKICRKIMKTPYNAGGVFCPPHFFHLHLFHDLSAPLWKTYRKLEDLKADVLVSNITFYPFQSKYTLFQVKAALNAAKRILTPPRGMKDFLYAALGPQDSPFIPLGYRFICTLLSQLTKTKIFQIKEGKHLSHPTLYAQPSQDPFSKSWKEEKARRDDILKPDLKRLVSAGLYLYLSNPLFQEAFLNGNNVFESENDIPTSSPDVSHTTLNEEICVLKDSREFLPQPLFNVDWDKFTEGELECAKEYIEALSDYHPQWKDGANKINEELLKRFARKF